MEKTKKKSIGIQLGVPLSIFLLLLIAGAMFVVCVFFVTKGMNERAEKSIQIAEYTASYTHQYRSIGWIVDYWVEHYPEMDLIYDSDDADALEAKLFEKFPGYRDTFITTTEQIAAADPEVQKIFAELCYSRMCREYDILQQSYHCTFLCSFTVRDGKCIYLTEGCDFGQLHKSDGGVIYDLGETMPFRTGVYPIVDNLLNGQPYLNETQYMIYTPVQSDQETDVDAFAAVYDEDGSVAMVISADNSLGDIISAGIRDALIITFIMIFMLALFILMLYHLLFKRVVKPIKREEAILTSYIEEKNSEKTVTELAEIKPNNEIETLAESFSYMTTELDRYINEVRSVTAEKERLGAELDMAASIQLSQLPRNFPAFPDRTEFDVFASMDPAKEVGGDFYDFFLIDEDHLAVMIADVSGKGIPAALFMMASKILIENYASMGVTPAEVLMKVNERICESNPDNMFVTVWLGIIDLGTGLMTCVNAGHEYPMLKKADGRFERFSDKHGLFVGAMKGMRYKNYELRMEKGDTIFVYTDGVPEATSAANELFGEERMIEALNASGSDELPEILRTVRARVDAFVGEAPQFDDLTMLAFRYFGK